jgi:hypothetical protein
VLELRAQGCGFALSEVKPYSTVSGIEKKVNIFHCL